MKHVQSCLRARKDQESSFHHCGSLNCEALASLSMCGKDLLKPFSQPRRCCGALASLFMCGKDLIKPF